MGVSTDVSPTVNDLKNLLIAHQGRELKQQFLPNVGNHVPDCRVLRKLGTPISSETLITTYTITCVTKVGGASLL